jgi:transcriptional regulator with XRE-family HTH domain
VLFTYSTGYLKTKNFHSSFMVLTMVPNDTTIVSHDDPDSHRFDTREVRPVVGICMEKIPELLKQLRAERNLSQQELASELGAGIASIKRWESGNSVPSQRYWLILDKMLQDYADSHLYFGSSRKSHCSSEAQFLFEEVDQLFENWQSARTKTRRDAYRDEAQIMPPIPRTDTEKSYVQKGTLELKIDHALLDLFLEEKEVRGLTESKLLETILWHRYGQPELSFRKTAGSSDEQRQGLSPESSADACEREQAPEEPCGREATRLYDAQDLVTICHVSNITEAQKKT